MHKTSFILGILCLHVNQSILSKKKLYKVPHIDMVVFKEPNHRKSEKKLYSKIYQIEGTFLQHKNDGEKSLAKNPQQLFKIQFIHIDHPVFQFGEDYLKEFLTQNAQRPINLLSKLSKLCQNKVKIEIIHYVYFDVFSPS